MANASTNALSPADWGDTPVDALPPPSARIVVTPKRENIVDPAAWGDTPVDDVSIPADMAKGLGIGVVRGGIHLAGALGDLRNGIHSLVDMAANKYGMSPEATAATKASVLHGLSQLPFFSAIKGAPTSEDIQKPIEEATGEFYKPRTAPGRVSEMAGEFVPGALMGPARLGSMASNALKFGVLPGAAMGTANETTDNAYLPPLAALGTSIVAHKLIRPSAPRTTLSRHLPEGVTPQHVDEAGALIADARARGVDLTWPEAMSRVSGMPVLTDMQRILESVPETRARMQRFMGPRAEQIDQAALNEFNQVAPGTPNPSTIGPAVGEAATGRVNEVRGLINNAAEPFYTASSTVRLTPQEMVQVRAIPGYQQARATLRDPQHPLNRYVAHLPDNSVGFLNEVKKLLDQQSQNVASVGAGLARNQQVSAAHTADAMRARQIGVNASQDYDMALYIEREGRRQYLDPLLQGPLGRLADKDITTKKAIEALFPSKPLANSHHEVETAVTALAQRNPWAATQLVRAHVEKAFNEASRALQSGPNQYGGANWSKQLVGNLQQRENLRAAIEALPNGADRWAGMNRFLEIVEATGTRQPRGSLTAFNALEAKAMEGGTPLAEIAKLGASPGRWWTLVHEKWGKWAYGNNLNELARIITDPNSGPLLRRIAAAPRDSREAAVLAARLIAQSTNAKPRDQAQ